ncbi:hypothetical protein FQA47_015694 [Oryzias melastigma]|uniref:Uncharacterized protein n=1 Tax=Oryzias melastigma TaxID=30732 RepID=A0A834CF77_ORYME|nr:hypothetical protein FQA47_015694 [Oryzias melastigma]
MVLVHLQPEHMSVRVQRCGCLIEPPSFVIMMNFSRIGRIKQMGGLSCAQARGAGGVGEVRSWECCVKRRRQKRLRLLSERLLCPSANRSPPAPHPLLHEGLAPQNGYRTGALRLRFGARRWTRSSSDRPRLSLSAPFGSGARACVRPSAAARARRSSPEQRSVGARGMSESRLALALS